MLGGSVPGYYGENGFALTSSLQVLSLQGTNISVSWGEKYLYHPSHTCLPPVVAAADERRRCHVCLKPGNGVWWATLGLPCLCVCSCWSEDLALACDLKGAIARTSRDCMQRSAIACAYNPGLPRPAANPTRTHSSSARTAGKQTPCALQAHQHKHLYTTTCCAAHIRPLGAGLPPSLDVGDDAPGLPERVQHPQHVRAHPRRLALLVDTAH